MNGKILTFYSFKGGVGRTMALANVAFLAAMNRKRVLVMDWDLEAPGLSYYFRGTLDATDAKSLRDAPGTLDLLWGWSRAAASSDEVQVTPSLDAFLSGTAFSASVRPLVSHDILPRNATLDYIGAGRKVIEAASSIPYEDALANFSWPMFFDRDAGGVFLESFRKWAKANYDLILIDSRTGMADVAGICTMQIPDQVALCFVLNKQNIDGISTIASAIRVKRSEEVSMRLVPMRLARENTSEESDARARALSGFVRTGGFSLDAVNEDFRSLVIPAADNVPFYETLAPLAASDPKYDPLTLRYVKLAETLIGQTLTVPEFKEDWIEMVRRRLQPRHATVDYVAKLSSADPLRARLELANLVESAYEAIADGASLDDEYLVALVNAVMSLDVVADAATTGPDLEQKTVNLLRALTADRPSTWSALLLRAFEHFLESSDAYASEEQELAILDELDALLATEPTIVAQIARLRYRLRAAKVQVRLHDFTAAVENLNVVKEITSALEARMHEMDDSQYADLQIASIEAFLLNGLRAEESDEYTEAVKIYEQALDKVKKIRTKGHHADFERLRADLHNRLSLVMEKVGEIRSAIVHGIEAVRGAGPIRNTSILFTRLGGLLESLNEKDLAVELCEAYFKGDESLTVRRLRFPQMMRSPTNQLLSVFSLLRLLLSEGGLDSPRGTQAVKNLSSLARDLAGYLARRTFKKDDEEHQKQLTILAEIQASLLDAGLIPDVMPDIFDEAGWPSHSPGERNAN